MTETSPIDDTIADKRTVELGENLTALDIVRIINDGGAKAKSIIESIIPSTGTESTFKVDETTYLFACQIDTNKIMVAWKGYFGIGGYLTSRVGTITGTTLSWGTENEDPSGSVEVWGLTQIATNKVLLCMKGAIGGELKIGTISGTTISWNGSHSFTCDVNIPASACYIATDKVLLSYWNSGCQTEIIPIIGNNFNVPGTTVPFTYTGTIYFFDTVKLDTDKALVITYDDAVGLTVLVVTVSGTVPTHGTEIYPGEFSVNYVTKPCSSLIQLDTDKAFYVYDDGGAAGKGVVISVSGTTPTRNTPVNFRTGSINYPSCALIDTNKVYISYKDIADSSYAKGKLCTISGTTPSYGSEVTLNAGISSYIAVAKVDDNLAFIGYEDESDSNNGNSVIRQEAYDVDYRDDYIGIIDETGVSGETKNITYRGQISSGHTGLTPGVKQYIQTDGSIGTTVTEYLIGTAISSTEILTE